MAPRKKPQKRAAKHKRGPTPSNANRGSDAGVEIHDLLVEGWSRSRAGGRSGRGYHFQDAAGAWLAARIAAGQLTGDLVPEGFDDMTIEGDPSNNHQIKSRAEHLGPFPASEAAAHVLDAWEADQARPQPATVVTVILERGVATPEDLVDPTARLANVLTSDSPLQVSIKRVATRRHLATDQLDQILQRTVLLGLSWPDVDQRTDTLVASLASVPPAAHAVLRRVLYGSVARATDINGSASYDQRERLTRTNLVAAISTTAELIDVDGLEAALRDGLCSPLQYEHDPRATDAFYEGTASQPAHLASGLIVPRPDLAAQAVAAIDAGQPVVIVGPSGVGKSAIAWTVPAALTGILWFNIHRLETADHANALVRLARAHNASADAPVGLILDGAGTGQRTGWAHLRVLAAVNPGIVLLATARNEDLPTLGSLTDVSTVAVTLDANAAATIFSGLKRRSATTTHHWREAFEESNGLTLEFTHLLTRGQRIDDVISEQIHRRLTEERDDELDLLSIVALADQWSATIETDAIQAATGTTTFDLRRSIDRLADEHLLAEHDGVLTGLHPVRSQAITRAIHRTPPPTISATFERTLALVSTPQLARFIAQALREDPTLGMAVIDVAQESLIDRARLAAFLQGLRLADADTLVLRWIKILEEQQMRRSLRTTLVMFTATRLDLGDLFPEPVMRAVEAMSDVGPGTLRDQLADQIGSDRISDALTGATVQEATALIATLDGWAGALEPTVGADTTLAQDLATAPIETVTKLLATANSRDDNLAANLIAAVGGADALLHRLHNENPWILRAEVRGTPDEPLGYARLLHVSDLQGDSRENCVALAGHLLRILPSIDVTDVKVRGPGYTPIIIDGYEHGVSGLIRRFDHPETRVAWNQTLMKTALTLMGASDTSRLAATYLILRDLVDLVAEVGARWVRSDNDPAPKRRLDREQRRLSTAGGDLPPPIGRTTVGDTSIDQPDKAKLTDGLSMLITDLTDNVFPRLAKDTNRYALAAFLRDSVQEHIVEARAEPWHLIPEGDVALRHLDDLAEHVWDLHDVLKAIGDDEHAATAILNTALNGSWKYALRRAADAARHVINHAEETRRAQFQDALRNDHPDHDITVLTQFRTGLTHFAVLIDLPSLLQWDEAAFVVSVRTHGGDNEQITIIPLRQARRIEGVGIRIGRNSDMPLLDVGEWEAQLPDAHPAEVGLLLRGANEALQLLSGLADLDETRRAHPAISTQMTDARARFDSAVEAITRRQGDEFCEGAVVDLNELMERVKAELDGDWQGPTYAQQLLLHLLGSVTDEGRDAMVRYLAALEWEIDPQQVRDLFDP